jgi:hypothetical protein
MHTAKTIGRAGKQVQITVFKNTRLVKTERAVTLWNKYLTPNAYTLASNYISSRTLFGSRLL